MSMAGSETAGLASIIVGAWRGSMMVLGTDRIDRATKKTLLAMHLEYKG